MESFEKMDADKLESELKSWSASSAEVLEAAFAETKREYKFSTPPDWNCVVCDKPIMSNLVYQCQTGHLACYKCSYSGKKCRKCSMVVCPIKNLPIEDMMKLLVVTCKFANLGCKEVFNYRDMEWSNHEENCCSAPMVCPMPSCNQVGVKNFFVEHLLSKHKISLMIDIGKRGAFRDFRKI